jgi:adenylate cyclase
VSLSNDTATDFFCDGLIEDLTTGLVRIHGLRVPARTTMARYKDAAVDLRAVGREHGVRGVLQGSVRRDGARIFVTTQLVDTKDGYHIWAERYERDSRDSIAVQREIAEAVVRSLSEVLRRNSRAVPEIDSDTMDRYHRARELLRIPVMKDGVPESVPNTVLESVRLFEEVTRRAPRFAMGWLGLAEAAEWEYELRGNRPPERLTVAKAAVEHAIQLQPDLAEGWTLLTSILFFREWDIRGAEMASRRAIELNPRDTVARQRYVDLLRIQGRTAEALSEIERTIRMQPAAAGLRVRRAHLLYGDGKCDEAVREAQEAAVLTNQMPVYPMTFWVQGLCHEQQGRFQEAEKLFRTGLSYQPHDPWNEAALGHLLAVTGRQSEAEVIVSELRRQTARGRLAHVSMAVIYTALGRKEDALASLERGWAGREDAVLFIGLDRRFRPLESEPRFQQLVTRFRQS